MDATAADHDVVVFVDSDAVDGAAAKDDGVVVADDVDADAITAVAAAVAAVAAAAADDDDGGNSKGDKDDAVGGNVDTFANAASRSPRVSIFDCINFMSFFILWMEARTCSIDTRELGLS